MDGAKCKSVLKEIQLQAGKDWDGDRDGALPSNRTTTLNMPTEIKKYIETHLYKKAIEHFEVCGF